MVELKVNNHCHLQNDLNEIKFQDLTADKFEFAALPPESPIEMPVQNLYSRPNIHNRSKRMKTEPKTIFFRRFY